MQKPLFCAYCQESKEHTFSVKGTELLAECGCGRFVKFPAHATKEELQVMFEAQSESNSGQIAVSSLPDPEDHPVFGVLAGI